jgi:NAD(P)-dependent dehydrogenase (short-subunit alcohol dehydrogenase family)
VDDFSGKVAVITGAASGIGLGIARQAAREGMSVVLADIEAAALDRAAASVAELGADTHAVPTDVTSADSVGALAAAAYDRFGAVHLLCNNAGVFQAGIVWERTRADWDWVMGVNFYGVLNGVQAFVPRMIEAGEPAHIVNTSSMAGVTTVAYSGPYVVSKFACAALTECLAHDMRAQGTSIGVSCLVPGAVATNIASSGRNRPPSLVDSAGSVSGEPPSEAQAPDHAFTEQMLADLLATKGREPDDAGVMVFDGLRAGKFWISTTEDYERLMAERFEALRACALPIGADYS